MDKQTLILPILLITVGVGWLLSTLGITPEINWVWTLGLFATGLLTFALYGFDKATLPIGGFFLTAAVLSVLRQTGRLSLDVEIPILVIVGGVLLLACRHPAVPTPKWLTRTMTHLKAGVLLDGSSSRLTSTLASG
jgi:hypothetical protein